MIDNKKILAVIPARGGSKGIPRKNMALLGGKPLIAWTIEQAQASEYIDRLIISSDDDELIKTAQSLGCEVPFKRPAAISADITPGIEPVIHAIKYFKSEYHYTLLLQPTSPFRSKEDIDGSIELCHRARANACVSVVKSDKNPYWMYTISSNGAMKQVVTNGKSYTRRQDYPIYYSLNGAIYLANSKWIMRSRTFIYGKTIAFLMPGERSLDIDTDYDLKIANLIKESEIDQKNT